MSPETNPPQDEFDRGFFDAVIGNGRPLLTFTGALLILAGGFALFLSATGQFLPHDVQYLGMTAEQLCAFKNCSIVHFMFHDRVAFGGALISIGALYIWLAEFPLRQGQSWAWWLFVANGVIGFGSFLAYLGYGYLDTWHGAATLFLLAFFLGGLFRSRAVSNGWRGIKAMGHRGFNDPWRSTAGIGRVFLLATAAGMIFGGLTVMGFGMTRVFVPQDLEFMQLEPSDLRNISDRLVPLIAHDRAGFGGAIATTGVLVLFSGWCGKASRSLWQVLALAGVVGFAAAIGVHPLVGYTDLFHLAPAFAVALMFVIALVLSYRSMCVDSIRNQPG
jgi:hypothetical protein